MWLFYILLLIYALFVVGLVIIYCLAGPRRYWERSFSHLGECPFGTDPYHIEKTFGKIRKGTELIVSYSLYGNYEKYSKYILLNIPAIEDRMPDWQVHVYAGQDIPRSLIREMTKLGAVVHVMGPHPPLGHEGATWRFIPASGLVPFISAEADDVFTDHLERETKAWLDSGKTFCNFVPFSFTVPMGAGLWGARPILHNGHLRPAIPNILDDINEYCEHHFGFDEAYLKNRVWPIVKEHGYYQSQSYHLADLGCLGIFALIVLILLSLYLSY